MKPDAPDTIRGLFQPIATSVPGISISELLPRLAQRADKLAIVRTVHHSTRSHNSGMYWSIVGRPYRIDSTLINPSRSDYPSFGTLVGWLARRDGYTGAAAAVRHHAGAALRQHGLHHARPVRRLPGRTFDPFVLERRSECGRTSACRTSA